MHGRTPIEWPRAQGDAHRRSVIQKALLHSWLMDVTPAVYTAMHPGVAVQVQWHCTLIACRCFPHVLRQDPSGKSDGLGRLAFSLNPDALMDVVHASNCAMPPHCAEKDALTFSLTLLCFSIAHLPCCARSQQPPTSLPDTALWYKGNPMM